MRLIDADELLNQRVYSVRSGKEFPYQKAYKNMLHDIENAPTVDAEPVRHGRWKITDQDVMGEKTLMCSYCTSVTKGFTFPNYCFNCGAKMDESEADE